MSEPTSLKVFGLISMIPYYICWFIVTGMYIFVSPGLMDPINDIPFYQVVMAAVYLVFGFAYPIYISIILSNSTKELGYEGDDAVALHMFHEIFSADEASEVLIPFIILFAI